MKNKYKETDKQISKKIMKEFEGKTVEHECQFCQGRGWTWHKNEITQQFDRVGCDECNATGKYELEY